MRSSSFERQVEKVFPAFHSSVLNIGQLVELFRDCNACGGGNGFNFFRYGSLLKLELAVCRHVLV